jgi:copper resistance protein B
VRGLLVIGALAFAGPALAQADHAGHHMPAPAPADPHAGHHMAAPVAADPHAGHHMPPAAAPTGTPPQAPTDHAAERFYSPQAMAAARAQLAREHGGGTAWKVMLSTAELRPDDGPDAYTWEGEAWWGNDDRHLVLKTEGEGAKGALHQAEVQALWSKPIGPYFDLQAGLRQDLAEGPNRTHAVLGFEGLAPYWFELEGAAFLSDEGELTGRLEASYDLRLTQKLILEPRAEVNLSATDAPELALGSGLTGAELGLRLRYEFKREFAPYVGLHHERRFGATADYARAVGESPRDTRLVVGLRAWF